MFPAEYQNQILIAEHGSWNSSTPVGYRITRVQLNESRAVRYEVFARGWLGARGIVGRPVDLLELPDGSLLVSDDYKGVVYRITYREND
jgi:glucose/arabinose dehydrogenase